jgi:hypothetical protein
MMWVQIDLQLLITTQVEFAAVNGTVNKYLPTVHHNAYDHE